MKRLLFAMIALLLTSCTPMAYHQVYKAKTETGVIKDNIVFEDENCTVSYNLWSENGDAGFVIYNKTDFDISIDLTKTFFIVNGESKAYYQNRTFSKTTTIGVAVNRTYNNNINSTKGGSSSLTTTYAEMPIIIIPGKTSKRITEYVVFNGLYKECKYVKYPTKKTVTTLNFDKKNSPIVFSNIITYSIKGVEKRIENEFYVCEITNYPSTMMYKTETKNECGEVLLTPQNILIYKGPDVFFNKYFR